MTLAIDDLSAAASAAFDPDGSFDRFGKNNFWIRFLGFLNDFTLYLLRRSRPAGERAREAIFRLIFLYHETGIERADMCRFLLEAAAELDDMPSEDPQTPWSTEQLPAEVLRIPTMLEPSAMRYYRWLARTLPLSGAVVELGCWMGSSTACLAAGLLENPDYQRRKLVVFDTFRWQRWMYRYTEGTPMVGRFAEGESFVELFREFCEPFRDVLQIREGIVSLGDVPRAVHWRDEPIGALIVDHSDGYEENLEVWQIFSPWCIPKKTVVVFNQYGNLRAEELRRFCRERRGELEPLHWLDCSCRSFLFQGSRQTM